MSQELTKKQSIFIGAMSGALVLLIGASAFLYFQSKNQSQAISQLKVTQEKVVEKPKALQLPSNEVAFKELNSVSDSTGKLEIDPNKPMNFWFEQSIKIGTDNLHVKFFKSQSPNEANQSDVIGVGAITYKESAGHWEVISKQPQFGEILTYGISEEKPETLQIAPTSLAVMLNTDFGGQGIANEGKTLFVFSENSWHNVGYLQTSSSNQEDCDVTPPPAGAEPILGPCWSYKGTISVVNGSTSDYPDLLVTRVGTESKEHRVSTMPARNVTYKYLDGNYINLDE